MSKIEDEEDEVTLEGTLALIKPEAVHKERDILEQIRELGFLVVERKRFRFSRDLAAKFYKDYAGNKPFYEELLDHMSMGGETVALCLARQDGIDKWRHAIGPKRVSEAMKTAPDSLRARYGDPRNDLFNALHGSIDPANSEREIELIFPHILHGNGDEEDEFEPRDDDVVSRELDKSMDDIEPRDSKEYLQRYVCPTLLKGLTEMYETKPKSPVLWLADWLEENNPNKI